MAYKPVSFTSSGWAISTDPKADPDKRWRAVHPLYGERFFDARHKVLEYTVKHMMQQFTKRAAQPGTKFLSWPAALCLHCGGRWLVPGDRDPKLLEGRCMDCQADSDTEKPLLFTSMVTMTDKPPPLPELPEEWLT
jgi:hypothetical protein